MEFTEVKGLFDKAGKRTYLLGDEGAGVVAALDLEGRLYVVHRGRVVNRINPTAISGYSILDNYHNPGGDGLWPAPEGTRLGYSYPTGKWRVPASIRHARFHVIETGPSRAVIHSEIDLVNSMGVGVPMLFERDIQLRTTENELDVIVTDSFQYLGVMPLNRQIGVIVPWSLCQFDCGPGCEVVFPARPQDVWDLYDTPSADTRRWQGAMCHAVTDGTRHYQIGLGEAVPWIEYRDPARKLSVLRKAAELKPSEEYIDIRDAAPGKSPDLKGVRYSIYSDPAGFMEIEAAGGCPVVIQPGVKLSQTISTLYTFG